MLIPLSLLAAPALAMAPTFEFPTFNSKHPQYPPQILDQHVAGRESEHGGAIALGRVRAHRAAPLRIVFDYAGYSSDPTADDSRRNVAEFRATATCV